jgi:two-component SAPR family response regulator
MTTAESPHVAVRYLGDFSLLIDGQEVSRWRAGKTRSLFQYLLVNRDRLVLRERLQEVLWPGVDWSHNSSSLKVAVHALRQILKDIPQSGGRPVMEVCHQDYGYVLRARGIKVDFEELESQFNAAQAAEARGDTAEALRCCRRVSALYAGDFLPGESADWVQEQREWNRSIALRAIDRLRADALAREQYTEVITWCRRILDIDPYREQVYRLLMYVHGRFGELGSVNGWYELCARRLREELDADPAPATRRLHLRAMRGELLARVNAPRRRPAQAV